MAKSSKKRTPGARNPRNTGKKPTAPVDVSPRTPPRTGAPKGNTNAIRHGLTSGKLPRDCAYVEIQMNKLRRTLEAGVLKARGEITIPDAAMIQTAVKWERHGALALRWLRLEVEDLSPLDRLHFSREIARASAERDRAIKALDLDAPPQAPWLIESHSEEVSNNDNDD